MIALYRIIALWRHRHASARVARINREIDELRCERWDAQEAERMAAHQVRKFN